MAPRTARRKGCIRPSEGEKGQEDRSKTFSHVWHATAGHAVHALPWGMSAAKPRGIVVTCGRQRQIRRNYYQVLEWTATTAEKEEIKPRLKVSLYYMYLLKRLTKVVKSTHLVSGNDDDAAEVDKFVDVLDLSNNYLFRDAVYRIWQNRETRLRKPEAMSDDGDIELLWSYTVRRCCRTRTSSGWLMSSWSSETWPTVDWRWAVNQRDWCCPTGRTQRTTPGSVTWQRRRGPSSARRRLCTRLGREIGWLVSWLRFLTEHQHHLGYLVPLLGKRGMGITWCRSWYQRTRWLRWTSCVTEKHVRRTELMTPTGTCCQAHTSHQTTSMAGT